MNRISPKKLRHSKWTAVAPQNKEKHFLVVEVLRDQEEVVRRCVLQAIHSRREFEIDWRDLKDAQRWRIGWH